MFPISTKGGGTCFAMPDVCKVPAPPGPPIPTPFPNIAQCMDATGSSCSSKVKVLNKPVLHKNSEIPMSMGDEVGVLKGVVSSTNMDTMGYTSSVPKVKIEGNEAVAQLCSTAHNGVNANAPGGTQIAPSQTKVLVT